MNKTNQTNETVPVIPPSGNETIPPTPPPAPIITVVNCSFYKVCRERRRCPEDQGWWDYWGGYGSYAGCGCSACSCEKKKVVLRKRICNVTMDDNFSVSEFNSNSSYYSDCDCAIFKNCSNETIVPETPIVPVPPVPPSGSACNYTCEDIRALHTALINLTSVVQSQQNDIDMLIGQYQDIVNRTQNTSGSVDSGAIAKIEQEIAGLYAAVNNATTDATSRTLAEIRDNGLRFGDEWWFGSQGSYLFAIDVNANSYYRFSPGKNITL